MAILKIDRSDVNTKGLVDILIDGVSNKKNYKQFKPSELEALNLIELEDGSVQVAMRIGQTDYNFTNTNVEINGVDQTGQTIDQIKDTLSLLFIDSTGGGGGTTDVSTPPHVVYKSAANELDDTTTIFTPGGSGSPELQTDMNDITSGERLRNIINAVSFILSLRFGVGTYKEVFNVEKINGIANEDFITTKGKALQTVRCIHDDIRALKRIIIGNGDDIVPVGTPLLRTILDELLLNIVSQVRDSAQENMFETTQGFDFFEIMATAAAGTIQKAMLRFQTMPDVINFIFNCTIGPATNPELTIKIDEDPTGPLKRISIGDIGGGAGPFMLFDLISGLYSLNASSLPNYTSDADAGIGGLITGQLYQSKVAGATGDVYAIAIKQ